MDLRKKTQRQIEIKNLILRIEAILPNVTCASQDLQRLRKLLRLELVDASILNIPLSRH
jgi:hypothetical protein